MAFNQRLIVVQTPINAREKRKRKKRSFAHFVFNFCSFRFCDYNKSKTANARLYVLWIVLQSCGFHLVGFLYLDSNPLAKAEKCFYTPHFFDRYKERTGLSADMSKVDVMKDWIMKNIHLNSDAQSSEK